MRCDQHTLRQGVRPERLSITVRHLVIYIETQSFSLVIFAYNRARTVHCAEPNITVLHRQ